MSGIRTCAECGTPLTRQRLVCSHRCQGKRNARRFRDPAVRAQYRAWGQRGAAITNASKPGVAGRPAKGAA